MAGLTTALVTAGAGLIGSGLQMFGASKDRKKARQALDNYERQDISSEANPYRNMRISTLGSDLAREENQRTTANAYDVLGTAGDRAILGGIGKVVASNNAANRQAQIDLDQQMLNREQAIAGGEMNLMGMREARDNQNIAAINSQLGAAQQRSDSGMMGMVSSIGAGVRAYEQSRQNDALEEIAKKGGGFIPQAGGVVTEGAAQTSVGSGVVQGAEQQGDWQPFRFYDFQSPSQWNPYTALNYYKRRR